MPTPLENISEQIELILKSNDLAEISGKTFDRWQKSVYYGIDQGFDSSKNRFNLPIIEWELQNAQYDQEAQDGGANFMNLNIRIYSGSFPTNKKFSQFQINKITTNILQQCKNLHDLSCTDGQINISSLTSVPFGFFQEISITFVISYDTDFGINY